MMGMYGNIIYRKNSKNEKHLLDVFVPSIKGVFPVLLFVHGGSWYNGRKEWYRRLGEHLAAKNIVSAIINYRLGHETTFDGMASDVAHAVKWTNENIENYKGDKGNILIAGHSAGGHLSALVSLNTLFSDQAGLANPLKGCILIDAFGLNMDYVMHNNQSFFVKELEKVFTKDPEQWKEAAPVRFVRSGSIPFLILIGSKTYPYLTMDNEIFKMNLAEHKVPFIYKTIKGRNHTEMITALENPDDPVYTDIIGFITGYSQLKPSSPAFFQ